MNSSHYYALFCLFSKGIGVIKGRKILEQKQYFYLDLENQSIKEKVEQELEKVESGHVHLVSIDEEAYPQILKEIPYPPILLYYQGSLDLKIPLGVVGTRKPNEYGKRCVRYLCESLLQYKEIELVSGLAMGIDRLVHNISIEYKRKTVAVLGSGLDIDYPKLNRDLRNKILDYDGLIVSEYPFGTLPRPENFPRRNRIISGLSHGLIVGQSSIKSGTLSTSKHALDQGKDVFSFPGNIFDEGFRGNHHLLKSGAFLIENVEDVLNIFRSKNYVFTLIDSSYLPLNQEEKLDLNSESQLPINSNFIQNRSLADQNKKEKKSITLESLPKHYTLDQRKILKYILETPQGVSLDDLIQVFNFDSPMIISTLTFIELDDLIQEKGGLYFPN